MKFNTIFKRFLAYFIDILVITCITSALAYISFINPKYKEYLKVSEEYNKITEQYYDKGLNTIESIGYVFCPQMINGIKTVSSHWVSLVTKAMETYTYDIRYVSISQLNDLVNNEINEI